MVRGLDLVLNGVRKGAFRQILRDTLLTAPITKRRTKSMCSRKATLGIAWGMKSAKQCCECHIRDHRLISHRLQFRVEAANRLVRWKDQLRMQALL